MFKTLVQKLSPTIDLSADYFSNISPKYSTRAKRLSLRVNPKTSTIELIIPPQANQYAIERFVQGNTQWIAARKQSLPNKIDIRQGAVFLYQGMDTCLNIVHHTKRTTNITHDDGCITIQTSRADSTTNLKRWMIDQARIHIEPLAHEKANRINKPISKIDLRDTSSRWGSCSSDGRLMLSWRLIFAPPYVLDYVVGHEVAHLNHMDHGQQFWDLCYDLSDEPEKAKQWLKNNGNHLLRLF